MLVCRLARVSPGRPEADLGVITIAPLRGPRDARRTVGTHDRSGSFGCHIVLAGDTADEHIEQHVAVDDWPTAPPPPAVDLLAHALNIARAERELDAPNASGIPNTAVMPLHMAHALVRITRAAIARGEAQPDRDLMDVIERVEEAVGPGVAI